MMLRLTILIFIGWLSLNITAQVEVREGRKGNAAYSMENYTGAEIHYRKAIESAGADYRHRFNLGCALYKQEKYPEAEAFFREAAELSADKLAKAAAFHNLGNTLLAAGKTTESIEAYKQSLRNNPADIETKYNLSYALKLLQEEEKKQQQQQQQQQQQDQQQQQQDQQQQEGQDQKPDSRQQEKNSGSGGISGKEAEQILKALENDEKKTMDKVNKQLKIAVPRKIEKDW